MKFLFVTLFPELIEQVCSYSIVGRGMSAGLLSVSCINPRDFTHDKHHARAAAKRRIVNRAVLIMCKIARVYAADA